MKRREALKLIGAASVGGIATILGFRGQSILSEKEITGAIPYAINNNKNKTDMKVLLLNGSPNKNGCTYTALQEVADSLKKNDVASEIIHIGDRPISGCRGCYVCANTGRCVVQDKVNEIIDRVDEFGGYIFGSPVHYASASGFITPFLDRLFCAGGSKLAFKPGAAIASCRRSGSITALDQMNRYFTFNNMPIVSSQYWNMVHGFTPEEVRKDAEGMQTMRSLGNNMAWMLKCIKAAQDTGISIPQQEERVYTNFIR